MTYRKASEGNNLVFLGVAEQVVKLPLKKIKLCLLNLYHLITCTQSSDTQVPLLKSKPTELYFSIELHGSHETS